MPRKRRTRAEIVALATAEAEANAAMAQQLRGRLSVRAPGRPVSLDLRGVAWGDLGIMTVRQPGTRGWPGRGPGTADMTTAQEWAAGYAPLVRSASALVRAGAGSLTVRQLLELYVATLPQGEAYHATRTNRASQARRLSATPLGGELAAAVTALRLEAVVGELTRADGRPLEPATRRALIDCLGAAWHAVRRRAGLQQAPPPWAGAMARNEDAHAERHEEAEREGVEVGERESPLTAAELLDALAWATLADRARLEPPGTRERALSGSTALGMALQTLTMTRVQEMTGLRWRDLYHARRAVGVRGTKTEAAMRHTLMPDALLPWLEEARKLYGAQEPGPDDYILRARGTSKQRRRAGAKSYGRRVLDVLVVAGLKRARASSHALRKTGITQISQSEVPDRALRAMIGHEGSDALLALYTSRAYTFPADWAALIRCPTPAEVRARAAELVAEGRRYPTMRELAAMRREVAAVR